MGETCIKKLKLSTEKFHQLADYEQLVTCKQIIVVTDHVQERFIRSEVCFTHSPKYDLFGAVLIYSGGLNSTIEPGWEPDEIPSNDLVVSHVSLFVMLLSLMHAVQLWSWAAIADLSSFIGWPWDIICLTQLFFLLFFDVIHICWLFECRIFSKPLLCERNHSDMDTLYTWSKLSFVVIHKSPDSII